MAKNKISNNLLSILLSFAILTSIVGILASMNILSPLTGAAVDTGTVTTNVTDSLSCSATDSTIAFNNLGGGGYNSSDLTADHHTIENNGNVNLSVQSYATAELWDSYSAPTKYWGINCNTTQSGTCNNTYGLLPNDGGTYWNLVSGLEPLDSIDALTVSVNITAPTDEANGEKSGTITYYCISV